MAHAATPDIPVPLAKFIRFTKVDAQKREVTGIVTAERPDKDHEVCDYTKSKPYYKKWSDDFSKVTDGESLGNLREMHQLSAVGKATELQFNDDEQEIVMTFKVVDDIAWKKVDERVYTGFSQGGRKVGEQVPDPVFKNCMRYVANPSEISLVDNPCLPDARFLYVKADGSTEMRKFAKVEQSPEADRVAALEAKVAELSKIAGVAADPAKPGPVLVKSAVTKTVGGQELTAADFAYVFASDDPKTWSLPIHNAAYVRRALAADLPQSAEKAKIYSKIVAAAKKVGVDVASEQQKIAKLRAEIRKAVRIYINTHKTTEKISQLDTEMGKLSKGMYEVSSLARVLDALACQFYGICCEQEYELDEDSQLPEMLRENVHSLTETLVAMVDEETRELLEHVDRRAA